MQIIDKTLHLPADSLSALQLFSQTENENYCIFDIETTGLSPKVSSVYLIGVLWYDLDEHQFRTRQWFADDYISEKEILSSFRDFLSNFTVLVNYNGTGFDISYIEKKCREFDIPSPFDNIKNLDIYRQIKNLKSFFSVPNLKLFTVEKLVGFMRKDILTGKDCIQIYSQFMQKKFFKDKTMETEKEKLLLHNIEDIIGTYYSAQLLFYKCSHLILNLTSTLPLVQNDTFLSITLPTSYDFPFPVEIEKDSHSITFQDNEICIKFVLYSGILAHFFKNYKDYYYLPAEGTAIHKSVGTYVDKDFREPAKASNCCLKKEGIFLPVPNEFSTANVPLFRSDYKSKQNYILWDEKTKQDFSLLEEILHLIFTSV